MYDAARPLAAANTPPDGERKTITALFADIKGSTELMRELDPEEARAIIDPLLQLMMDAVHRYDGYVVQSAWHPLGRLAAADAGQLPRFKPGAEKGNRARCHCSTPDPGTAA